MKLKDFYEFLQGLSPIELALIDLSEFADIVEYAGLLKPEDLQRKLNEIRNRRSN